MWTHGSDVRYKYLGRRRRAAARARLRCSAIGFRCRAHSAAGATWTSRTTSAPWAARESHTSVVDAAGAIYVIGGYNGGTVYQDVWVSTDEGARPVSVGGVVGGYTGWVLRGTHGYQGGTLGYQGGTKGYERGTKGVRRGTKGY